MFPEKRKERSRYTYICDELVEIYRLIQKLFFRVLPVLPPSPHWKIVIFGIAFFSAPVPPRAVIHASFDESWRAREKSKDLCTYMK